MWKRLTGNNKKRNETETEIGMRGEERERQMHRYYK